MAAGVERGNSHKRADFCHASTIFEHRIVVLSDVSLSGEIHVRCGYSREARSTRHCHGLTVQHVREAVRQEPVNKIHERNNDYTRRLCNRHGLMRP